MNFEFEKIVSNNITKVGGVEKAVELAVPTTESESVMRILGLMATGRAVSAEAANGEGIVSGRVNFKLLYLDAEGESCSLDYFADFVEKVPANINSDAAVYATVRVGESDISTDNGLELVAVVEICLFATQSEQLSGMLEAPEKCFAVKEDIETARLVQSKIADVDVSEEIETKSHIKKVLLLDSDAIISGAKAGTGTVTISGDFVATVTYMTDSAIKTEQVTIPFTEEVMVENAQPGDIVVTKEFVKSAKVVLTGTEEETIMRIDGVVGVKILVFRENKSSVVVDLFMLENELMVATTGAQLKLQKSPLYLTEKVTSMAMLGEDRPAVREVIGVVSSNNMVASAKVMDGKLTIEGVINAVVLYQDENGVNSVTVEVPYSKDFEVQDLDDCMVEAEGIVLELSARAKRDHEIELYAKLQFKVDVLMGTTVTLISDVALGEAKELNSSAFSVYIAGAGEGIWSASKALSASPDQIMLQNPDLKIPFEDGDRVFFFRQLGEEF